MGRSTRECRHELRIGAAHSPADRGVSAPAGASRTGEWSRATSCGLSPRNWPRETAPWWVRARGS